MSLRDGFERKGALWRTFFASIPPICIFPPGVVQWYRTNVRYRKEGSTLPKKETFILHTADYETIRPLSAAQKGDLLDAIFCHVRGEEEPDLDPMTRMAFRFMAAQLDRDQEKWEEVCRKRQEAGRKGAEARKANLANATFANQSLANQADTDTESESESESESDPETESDSDSEAVAVSEPDPVPPPVEAVAAYCAARNNHIDAEKFCDYYAARGWMLGRERMVDWRAAVRSWERRERAGPAQSPPPQEALNEFDEQWLADVRRQRAREKGQPAERLTP